MATFATFFLTIIVVCKDHRSFAQMTQSRGESSLGLWNQEGCKETHLVPPGQFATMPSCPDSGMFLCLLTGKCVWTASDCGLDLQEEPCKPGGQATAGPCVGPDSNWGQPEVLPTWDGGPDCSNLDEDFVPQDLPDYSSEPSSDPTSGSMVGPSGLIGRLPSCNPHQGEFLCLFTGQCAKFGSSCGVFGTTGQTCKNATSPKEASSNGTLMINSTCPQLLNEGDEDNKGRPCDPNAPRNGSSSTRQPCPCPVRNLVRSFGFSTCRYHSDCFESECCCPDTEGQTVCTGPSHQGTGHTCLETAVSDLRQSCRYDTAFTNGSFLGEAFPFFTLDCFVATDPSLVAIRACPPGHLCCNSSCYRSPERNTRERLARALFSGKECPQGTSPSNTLRQPLQIGVQSSSGRMDDDFQCPGMARGWLEMQQNLPILMRGDPSNSGQAMDMIVRGRRGSSKSSSSSNLSIAEVNGGNSMVEGPAHRDLSRDDSWPNRPNHNGMRPGPGPAGDCFGGSQRDEWGWKKVLKHFQTDPRGGPDPPPAGGVEPPLPGPCGGQGYPNRKGEPRKGNNTKQKTHHGQACDGEPDDGPPDMRWGCGDPCRNGPYLSCKSLSLCLTLDKFSTRCRAQGNGTMDPIVLLYQGRIEELETISLQKPVNQTQGPQNLTQCLEVIDLMESGSPKCRLVLDSQPLRIGSLFCSSNQSWRLSCGDFTMKGNDATFINGSSPIQAKRKAFHFKAEDWFLAQVTFGFSNGNLFSLVVAALPVLTSYLDFNGQTRRIVWNENRKRPKFIKDLLPLQNPRAAAWAQALADLEELGSWDQMLMGKEVNSSSSAYKLAKQMVEVCQAMASSNAKITTITLGFKETIKSMSDYKIRMFYSTANSSDETLLLPDRSVQLNMSDCPKVRLELLKGFNKNGTSLAISTSSSAAVFSNNMTIDVEIARVNMAPKPWPGVSIGPVPQSGDKVRVKDLASAFFADPNLDDLGIAVIFSQRSGRGTWAYSLDPLASGSSTSGFKEIPPAVGWERHPLGSSAADDLGPAKQSRVEFNRLMQGIFVPGSPGGVDPAQQQGMPQGSNFSLQAPGNGTGPQVCRNTTVLLLPPSSWLTYLMKPSSQSHQQQGWSVLDGMREAGLMFAAWDQTEFSAMAGLAVNVSIPPFCCKQECGGSSLSSAFGWYYAIKRSCNGQPILDLENFPKVDDCGKCGGDGSSCRDCEKKVNGGKLVHCGKCLAPSEQSYDCNGGCGGHTSLKRVNDEVCLDTRTAGLVPTTSASGGSGLAVAGCDGTFGSNATINRCGVCYGGRTNLTQLQGMDSCGLCNDLGTWPTGTLDPRPCPCPGDQTRDRCGVCSVPSTPDRDSCPEVLLRSMSVSPGFVDIATNQRLLSLEVLPANLDLSLAENISCSLTAAPGTQSSAKVQRAAASRVTFGLLEVVVESPRTGQFDVRCNFSMKGSRNVVRRQTPSKSVPRGLSIVNSDDLVVKRVRAQRLRGLTFDVEVEMEASLKPFQLTRTPSCGYYLVDRAETIVQVLRSRVASSANSSLVICPNFRVPSGGVYLIRLVYDGSSATTTTTALSNNNKNNNNARILLKSGAPTVVWSALVDHSRTLVIKFDMNVKGPSACSDIFAPSSFPREPKSCSFRADKLEVKAGVGMTLLDPKNATSIKFRDGVRIVERDTPYEYADRLDVNSTAVRLGNASDSKLQQELGDWRNDRPWPGRGTTMTVRGPRKMCPGPGAAKACFLVSGVPPEAADVVKVYVRYFTGAATGTNLTLFVGSWTGGGSRPDSSRQVCLGRQWEYLRPAAEHQVVVEIGGHNRSKVAAMTRFYLLPTSSTMPSVYIDMPAGSNETISVTSRLVLSAVTVDCSDPSVTIKDHFQHYWSTNGSVEGQVDWTSRSLVVPKLTLAGGKVYNFSVIGIRKDPSGLVNLTIVVSDHVVVRTAKQGVVAILASASLVSSLQNDVLIDGSQSHSIDNSSADLQYMWYCREVKNPGQSCSVLTSEGLRPFFSKVVEKGLSWFSSSQLIIPAGSLPVGEYIIALEVSSGESRSTTECKLKITGGSTPQLLLVPAANSDPVNPSLATRTTVLVSGEAGTCVRWEGSPGPGCGSIDLVKVSPKSAGPKCFQTATAMAPFHLELPPGALEPATEYRFRAVASLASGGSSAAEVIISTRAQPPTGTLTVVASMASEPTGPFFNVSSKWPPGVWYDFEYFLKDPTVNEVVAVAQVRGQGKVTFRTLLPALSAAVRVQMVARACDDNNACSELAVSNEFTVNVANAIRVIELLRKRINDSLNRGDLDGALTEASLHHRFAEVPAKAQICSVMTHLFAQCLTALKAQEKGAAVNLQGTADRLGRTISGATDCYGHLPPEEAAGLVDVIEGILELMDRLGALPGGSLTPWNSSVTPTRRKRRQATTDLTLEATNDSRSPAPVSTVALELAEALVGAKRTQATSQRFLAAIDKLRADMCGVISTEDVSGGLVLRTKTVSLKALATSLERMSDVTEATFPDDSWFSLQPGPFLKYQGTWDCTVQQPATCYGVCLTSVVLTTDYVTTSSELFDVARPEFASNLYQVKVLDPAGGATVLTSDSKGQRTLARLALKPVKVAATGGGPSLQDSSPVFPSRVRCIAFTSDGNWSSDPCITKDLTVSADGSLALLGCDCGLATNASNMGSDLYLAAELLQGPTGTAPDVNRTVETLAFHKRVLIKILANFAATAGDATRKGRFLRAIRVQVTNKFGIPPRYIRKLDCRRGSVLLSLELAATADAPIGALMASYSRLQQQLSSGTLELYDPDGNQLVIPAQSGNNGRDTTGFNNDHKAELLHGSNLAIVVGLCSGFGALLLALLAVAICVCVKKNHREKIAPLIININASKASSVEPRYRNLEFSDGLEVTSLRQREDLRNVISMEETLFGRKPSIAVDQEFSNNPAHYVDPSRGQIKGARSISLSSLKRIEERTEKPDTPPSSNGNRSDI